MIVTDQKMIESCPLAWLRGLGLVPVMEGENLRFNRKLADEERAQVVPHKTRIIAALVVEKFAKGKKPDLDATPNYADIPRADRDAIQAFVDKVSMQALPLFGDDANTNYLAAAFAWQKDIHDLHINGQHDIARKILECVKRGWDLIVKQREKTIVKYGG